MKSKFKRIVSFVFAATMVLTLGASAVGFPAVDKSSEFNIVLEDTAGNPVADANVYLFSYDDNEIVKSGISDETGICEIIFTPEYDTEEENSAGQVYKNFLIYIQKSGFNPQPYQTTKVYGLVDEGDNETDYLITLSENPNYTVNAPVTVNSTESSSEVSAPFTVTRADPRSRAVGGYKVPGFWNADVPIGEFHIDNNGTLDVAYTASDSVIVEAGFQAGGGITVSGSRKCDLENLSKSEYASFTATSNQGMKKIYYTGGTFETSFSTDSFSGDVFWYYTLESIDGGTTTSTPTVCTKCKEDWNGLLSADCTLVKIENGSSVTISYFKSRTIDYGLSVPFKNGSTTVFKFGVTTKTSNSTSLKYTPKAGHQLRVYDEGRDKKVWHVSSI